MTTNIEKLDNFAKVLDKYDIWRFLRVAAWIKRFINNFQETNCNGLLKTEKIEQPRKF